MNDDSKYYADISVSSTGTTQVSYARNIFGNILGPEDEELQVKKLKIVSNSSSNVSSNQRVSPHTIFPTIDNSFRVAIPKNNDTSLDEPFSVLRRLN